VRSLQPEEVIRVRRQVISVTMRFPALLATAAATLLLVACGGDSNRDPSAGDPDAKRLAFNECMRKAGFDVREEVGAGGRGTSIRIPNGLSRQRVQTIQRDCARKTGGGPREPSKAEQAKLLDQALKFARCMRAHGVDMPDPQADGGGIRLSGPGKGSIDPAGPAFQRAQRACESLLPGGKGPPMKAGAASGSAAKGAR
jgi:hypothetical protein